MEVSRFEIYSDLPGFFYFRSQLRHLFSLQIFYDRLKIIKTKTETETETKINKNKKIDNIKIKR
jgi:hypothetical protein